MNLITPIRYLRFLSNRKMVIKLYSLFIEHTHKIKQSI